MKLSIPNSDENIVNVFSPADPDKSIPFIGNYHKTLPHNEFGEVVPSAYLKFKDTCLALDAGAPVNFNEVPGGTFNESKDPAKPKITLATKFNNPQAGAATEAHGLDPKDVSMPPAPGILSKSTAAEMVELYWMALLRDIPLDGFETNPNVVAASEETGKYFQVALEDDHADGALALGRDLPVKKNGQLDSRPQTLFRCGLEGEDVGPFISQFFLRDIAYGTQTISSKQVPYIMGENFLTNHDDWLRAQNTGKDKFGRDYGGDNNYADQLAGGAKYYPLAVDGSPVSRYISTPRDLARFVNRDALHQAYFNAALFLDSIGTPLDAGNPYKGNQFSRETNFGTLGGPDLLTLVSEVASRALKVIWRQKWLVHRRARPEVYGGLLQMQFKKNRSYGLPDLAKDSSAAGQVLNKYATYFLPMAFSAGSPPHPAYGAGHATVAGACVTVLKAWFDEDAKLADVICNAKLKDPVSLQGLLQSGKQISGEQFGPPTAYAGNPAEITVGGELNKVASNVAMGRSIGGVHWRSDNTRSLRVGEQLAIEILRKRTLEYAERPVSFSFRSFDRKLIRISQGQVQVINP